MMQQAPDREQLANAILQIALKNSVGLTVLSDLATALSKSLNADGCIVISRGTESFQVNGVGCWQAEAGLVTEAAIEQLSHLAISQEIPLDSQKSPVIETTSPLFDGIDSIIQNTLPTHAWLGITTQFQDQTNGLVLLLKSQALPGLTINTNY
jgi:hypothetical protein